MSAGKRLRMLRKQWGMTQEQMAEIMCCSRSHVASIETECREVSAAHVKLLSLIKRVNPQWLLEGTGERILHFEHPKPIPPKSRETVFWEEMEKNAELLIGIVARHKDPRIRKPVTPYANMHANASLVIDALNRARVTYNMEARRERMEIREASFCADADELADFPGNTR